MLPKKVDRHAKVTQQAGLGLTGDDLFKDGIELAGNHRIIRRREVLQHPQALHLRDTAKMSFPLWCKASIEYVWWSNLPFGQS